MPESRLDATLEEALDLHRAGRLAEAERRYRQVLQATPDYPDALHLLGLVAHQGGRNEEALELIGRALAVDPRRADFLASQGVVKHVLGHLAQAEECYRAALALQAGDAQTLNKLGVVQFEQGRLAEAEQTCREALRHDPRSADAHSNLATFHMACRRFEDAERGFRQALACAPDLAPGWSNLGNALRKLGRLQEAEASHRRALEIDPRFGAAHSNLGHVYRVSGRPALAEQSYRRALELNPGLAFTHTCLIFVMDLIPGRSIAEQQQERRRWYLAHGQKHAASVAPHPNDPDPERRLRIGYVSGDFWRHSAYAVFAPTIKRHDAAAFEVYCYSGAGHEDEATESLRARVPVWRRTAGMTDAAVAEQIRSDHIDVLVDLSGHTPRNRLLAFARKPAPVQVTAWGYATGTGLATMDYFFGDPVLVPPQERQHYAEEVIDLPCWGCFEPPAYMPAVAPLPAMTRDSVTFGCVNRVEKISDALIGLWARILAVMPHGRLLIKDQALNDPYTRELLMRRLAAAGIEAARALLLGASNHAEHLKTYDFVDLTLDPFPQGGGVSTFEALWMGVPPVTLRGDTATGRVSASILTALGMHDWIAENADDYVKIAVEMARDLPRLARLRQELRARLAASAVGNLESYTLAVERAYRTAWRRWCMRSSR